MSIIDTAGKKADVLPQDFLNEDKEITGKVPNATTVATFEATDRGEDIVRCKDAADMFDKLGLVNADAELH